MIYNAIRCFLFLMLVPTTLIVSEEINLPRNHANTLQELPLYYWDARPSLGFSNFGDELSEKLIERMIGHKIRIVQNPFNGQKNF